MYFIFILHVYHTCEMYLKYMLHIEHFVVADVLLNA